MMPLEQHLKTHHHIKKAQVLIIVAIGINLAMFVSMYSLLTGQMGNIEGRVEGLGGKLQTLDSRSSENFELVTERIVNISGDLERNAEDLDFMNDLLERLGEDIIKVEEESMAGIQSIKSELNYTGTINDALESTVLIVWTDKTSIIGSGFIVSKDGYILTAEHVIDSFGDKTIRVQMRGGDLHIADLIASDEDVDVAILKADFQNSTYLDFGDSDGISSGAKVFALGAPEGFAFSASEGIVSAVRSVRSVKDDVGLDLGLRTNIEVVQTDAAITHGNSGGPLINSAGEVIGLNSFGISKKSGSAYQDVEGLNFAIASNDVKEAFEDSL